MNDGLKEAVNSKMVSKKPNNSKHKICVFLPSLGGGGAERVFVTLANEFAARGHTVVLIVADSNGPQKSKIANDVTLYDLKKRRVIECVLPLRNIFKTVQPDVVLSALNHANLIAIIAHYLSRVNARIYVSERNTLSVEIQNNKGFKFQCINHLVSRLYPRANKVIAVSRGVGADLVSNNQLKLDSIQTIYNPFDITRIQALANEPLNDSWFQPGEPPVILGIGRLVRQKGFSVLINAFSRALKIINARLLILGNGQELELLKELGSSLGLDDEKFRINPFVDNPFVYMARCKVFVLSSFWEGLPGVLVEALACGANVVSTDCPSGPSEILEDGKWGKLVPVGCPEMLSEAIVETIISDQANLPEVRFRAEQFAKDRIVTEYLSVMNINCADK